MEIQNFFNHGEHILTVNKFDKFFILGNFKRKMLSFSGVKFTFSQILGNFQHWTSTEDLGGSKQMNSQDTRKPKKRHLTMSLV